MHRHRYRINGQVQGVGFRPFIYRIAHLCGLSGFVNNSAQGVEIEVQGQEKNLEKFNFLLHADLPPLAKMLNCTWEKIDPVPQTDNNAEIPNFTIITTSYTSPVQNVFISPDMAPCANCLADMAQKDNRRYQYPFTNCTDCGPRYTIICALPYDRPSTSMACFPMCSECQAEYENPLDRRFHAQPNACPLCGPYIWLQTPNDDRPAKPTNSPDVLDQAAQLLVEGKILAIKGLGGFHLACSAHSTEAIERLRQAKQRPHKALAIMVGHMDSAHTLAQVSEDAALLLQSQERPIVVCPLAPTAQKILASNISPDTASVGIMLPSTPLHALLLEEVQAKNSEILALVMTSGNAGGEPLCVGNREALDKLGHIADSFLLHNRDIVIRIDDSVVLPAQRAQGTFSTPRIFLRRARGYAPQPLPIFHNTDNGQNPCILAVGAELKNTLCITKNGQAYISQHMGDLRQDAIMSYFEEIATHLMTSIEAKPEKVVCDEHPNYLSTLFAQNFAEQRGIPLVRVQHHFAHLYSVLAEHNHAGPALGLMLDGAGLGQDGTLWGGELLLVDGLKQKRLGRLAPFSLAGGDQAARHPWRVAEALWQSQQADQANPILRPWQAEPELALVQEMLIKNVGCTLTSSCGRLFDAVAALCGLCFHTTYEGQAAILLENAQDFSPTEALPVGIGENQGLLELDTFALFHQLAQKRSDLSIGKVARLFHVSLAQGLARMAEQAARQYGVKTIALAGGVMSNQSLAQLLPQAFHGMGLKTLLHQSLPPGDAAISYGQAAYARLQK